MNNIISLKHENIISIGVNGSFVGNKEYIQILYNTYNLCALTTPHHNTIDEYVFTKENKQRYIFIVYQG